MSQAGPRVTDAASHGAAQDIEMRLLQRIDRRGEHSESVFALLASTVAGVIEA